MSNFINNLMRIFIFTLYLLIFRWSSRPGCAACCSAMRRAMPRTRSPPRPPARDAAPAVQALRAARSWPERSGRARRHRLYWGILAAIVMAIGLVAAKLVVLKMLPFDNKSEFQVDRQSSARQHRRDDRPSARRALPGHRTGAGSQRLSRSTPAPPRRSTSMDWCASTTCGRTRGSATSRSIWWTNAIVSRKSHDIALAVRPALAAIGRRYAASVQVVEVPPGPPVRAPIVAEVYGPRYAEQRQLAERRPQAVRLHARYRRRGRQRRGVRAASAWWMWTGRRRRCLASARRRSCRP